MWTDRQMRLKHAFKDKLRYPRLPRAKLQLVLNRNDLFFFLSQGGLRKECSHQACCVFLRSISFATLVNCRVTLQAQGKMSRNGESEKKKQPAEQPNKRSVTKMATLKCLRFRRFLWPHCCWNLHNSTKEIFHLYAVKIFTHGFRKTASSCSCIWFIAPWITLPSLFIVAACSERPLKLHNADR